MSRKNKLVVALIVFLSTCVVLIVSLVGDEESIVYSDYEVSECGNTDSPYPQFETRYAGDIKQYRFRPEPAQLRLLDDSAYRKSPLDVWRDYENDDGRINYEKCFYIPVPTTVARYTTTTSASISSLSQCKADLKAIDDNLETASNALFDRLFRKSLSSCVNKATWNAYAPSSIRNMLTASCILYSSDPVCKN